MSLEPIKLLLETITFLGLLVLTILFLRLYYPTQYYLGLAGFWTLRAMYNILRGGGIFLMCVDILVVACYLWVHYHKRKDDDDDDDGIVVKIEAKKEQKELVQTI